MNFLKKIFSPTILTISFLLLIYTFYKSEIYLDGEKRNYYKTYYIISSILICFSIITFFINDIIKQYLIISGISVIVSLYLFEGYLNFEIYLNSKEQLSKEQLSKEQLYKEQTGKKWDKRKKVEIYNDLKKINNKVVPSFHPELIVNKNYPIFPLSGVPNRETIYCNENGYYSIYQSDRYGFNNPDKEWDEKEINYLLVGDSFTDGACVNRPNDIASVLRKLTDKSVITIGYGGNGPLLEYASLKEFLNPDIKKIIWAYYEGNDFFNLEHELKNKILIKYLNDKDFSQNLKSKQNQVDIAARQKIHETKKNALNKFDIFKYLKLYKLRSKLSNFLPKKYQPTYNTPSNDAVKAFKRTIFLAKELANKNNSKLYFVYLPEYSRYKTNYNETNKNLVRKIVSELHIPFIDIDKEVFEKEQNPLKLFPFELKGHYNIEGYKKVAEKIYQLTKD